jgi:hypothetical protein
MPGLTAMLLMVVGGFFMVCSIQGIRLPLTGARRSSYDAGREGYRDGRLLSDVLSKQWDMIHWMPQEFCRLDCATIKIDTSNDCNLLE